MGCGVWGLGVIRLLAGPWGCGGLGLWDFGVWGFGHLGFGWVSNLGARNLVRFAKASGLGLWVRASGLLASVYVNLPKLTFLQVLVMNLYMELIGTLKQSRFW